MSAAEPKCVLLTDYAWPDLEIEERLVGEAGHKLLVAPDSTEKTLIGLARKADAILTCWASVTGAVIDACLDCRIVGRLGIGLDNIDVAHCTERGIPVTNVPAYCTDEVAEHALALLLALARNVGFFHLRTKGGEYSLTAGGELRRIAGRTLGICGFGQTGQALARKAAGLGMNVLVWNRSAYAGDLPVTAVSFDDLLGRSDMVSLHLPLTDDTRHLFDAAAFEKMKPSAILVNTARGPLLDATALAEALSTGKLAGAGLDVQDPEPPDLSDVLYRSERVIVTPHAAFASRESVRTLRETAVRCVLECLAGRRPDHVVNPDVFEPPNAG